MIKPFMTLQRPYSDNFGENAFLSIHGKTTDTGKSCRKTNQKLNEGTGWQGELAPMTIRILFIVLRVTVQDSSFQSPSKFSRT